MAKDVTTSKGTIPPSGQKPAAKPDPKPLSTIQRRDVRTSVAKTRGW